jgi:tetratricopeptide (TPR) repeat protein
MENKYYELETIEAYLDRKLSADDIVAFEAAMASDEMLKKEVKDVSKFISGIRYTAYKRKKTAELLQAYRAELPEFKIVRDEAKIRSIFNIPYFTVSAIAASVAIFVIATVLFFNNSATPEELLAEYHTAPYPVLDANSMVNRGKTPDTQTKRQEAFVAYSSGEFDTAISLFIEVLRQEPDDEVRFYLANAYFEQKRIKEAIVHLQELSQSAGKFKTRGMWYLALCYIQENDLGKARQTVELLSKEQDSYSVRAKEMLDKM